MRGKLILIAPLAIVGMALLAYIGGEVVMHLWNWLLPSLFGWHELTFWKALGMLALCRILFGGCGWRGSYRSRSRTPEERERLRQGLRRWFGMAPSTGESTVQ